MRNISSKILFLMALAINRVSCITIEVPPVAVTTSDVPLTLSSARFDAISIDGTLDEAADIVGLQVDEGSIQLAQQTGLSDLNAATSGNGQTMTFKATTASANAALDGLKYSPPAGFAGRPTLMVTVTRGGVETASATLRIAVNQAIPDQAALVNSILDGVSTIHGAGNPGFMVASGPTAYKVSSYPGSTHQTMIAAATYGKGRIIAVPDHEMLYLDVRYATASDFFFNGLDWLANSNRATTKTKKIVVSRSRMVAWMKGEGYTNVVLVTETTLVNELADADVFVGWLGSTESEANLEALKVFVAEQGKSLFIGEYGRGYDGFWWNVPLSEAPGNILLREPGISFSPGITYFNYVINIESSMKATTSLQIDGDTMLDILGGGAGTYSADEKKEAGFMMTKLHPALPTGDPLLNRIDALYESKIITINPTPANPVTDIVDQGFLKYEGNILATTPAEEVVAHRTAEAVYGAIPAGAERVTETVSINTDRTMWLPTGLYAAPGDLVTVTVPEILVNRGYNIRVNPHVEDISVRTSWSRPPKVHRYFPIDATEVKVANAFGGSIFIDLGSRRDDRFGPAPGNGIQQFTIANAIRQPYFALGVHTDQQWLDTIKNYPAPVAVFECDELILVQKASDADIVTEPTALMQWWQQVSRHEDYMGSYDVLGPRVGPDLIDVDVQTDYGAANAGFPITAWDGYWGNVFDLDNFRKRGSWGDFHELGHNHQRKWWTWSGDGEVTVNIFSAYVLSAMGYPYDTSSYWSYTVDEAATMVEALKAVNSGTEYSKLTKQRLPFWIQLAHGFGWESMRNVIRSYEVDEKASKLDGLTSQADRKCEWLKRYSDEVQRDLRKYMVDTWKLEVDSACQDEVAALGYDSWLPAFGTVKSMTVLCETPTPINIAAGTLSFDGIADVSIISTNSGTVTASGDSYLYAPSRGFKGTDTFVYSVRSSAGDVQEVTVSVDVGLVVRLTRKLSNGSYANWDLKPTDVIARGRTLWEAVNANRIVFYCPGQDKWVATSKNYRDAVLNSGTCGGFEYSERMDGTGTGEFYEYNWGDGSSVAGVCSVPTDAPTDAPTDTPTDAPTDTPTDAPTDAPTETPTDVPTDFPTDNPTDAPTVDPWSLDPNLPRPNPDGSITGTHKQVTKVCALTGSNCCVGERACVGWSGIARIYPGACQGRASCARLGNRVVIGKNSCVGTSTCHTNVARIGRNSCIGNKSCRNNEGQIGHRSCTKNLACTDNTGQIGNRKCKRNRECMFNTLDIL